MQDHSLKYFLIDVTWPLEKQKQQKSYYIFNASSASVESIIDHVDIYNMWRQTAILKKNICLSYTDLKSEKAKAFLL